MKKKRALAVILATAMVIGIVGCGSSSSSTSTSSSESESAETEETSSESESSSSEEAQESETHENVTLRFYNYALSETDKAEWWQDTIDDFTAQYDWIDIETIVVDYNSMVTTLTNDLASGLSADIIYGEISWIPALVDGGFIQDPANVLSADFYSGYYDYVLDQFVYEDTVYGVPHYFTNSVIYCNKDLIEAAGLSMDDFPDTEDGLKEWIETLDGYYADDDSVTTIFGLTTAEVSATGANINAIYLAFGGELITADGELADLKSGDNYTAMTEMLDFYDYLINNGYTQENLKLKDYRSAFGAGNVCMYVDSSWGYAQISSQDENAADFTVSATMPTTMGTNGTGGTIVESNCFLLGSGLSGDSAEAVDLFIQYCTQADTMQEYMTEIGLAFPAHEDTASIELSPILEGAAEGIDNVIYQPLISSTSSVQVELATMVLNYVVNGMSADEAIDSYITEAEYYINQ